MQNQSGLLLTCLKGHEPHCGPLHGFRDRFRIGSVIFLPCEHFAQQAAWSYDCGGGAQFSVPGANVMSTVCSTLPSPESSDATPLNEPASKLPVSLSGPVELSVDVPDGEATGNVLLIFNGAPPTLGEMPKLYLIECA